MKKKTKFLSLLFLYTKLCGDFNNTSLSDISDNFQVIIDPLNKAVLSAQLSTPVKRIHKKLGESFNKGETLLELDSGIYVAQLKKARAVLEKAQNTYQAKEELFQARIASLSDLKEAYALWATAQAEFEVSKKQLEACRIVAPYRGKVANVLLYEHELPQVGQPLVEVVGDEILLAKMLIDAKYLSQISYDKPIKIYVNELKQSLPARIKRIGSVIDPASSTISIEAEMDNPDSSLISGMTGLTAFSLLPDAPVMTANVQIEDKPILNDLRPAIMEVAQKAAFITKTIFKDEGQFSEEIKSGVLPQKFKLATITVETPSNLPVEDHLTDENIAIDALKAQKTIVNELSEPKQEIKAPINYNGELNQTLAEECAADSSNASKARFYRHEGILSDKLTFAAETVAEIKDEVAKIDPIQYEGSLDAILNETSYQKSLNNEKTAILIKENNEKIASLVKEAEDLDNYLKALAAGFEPLTYFPPFKEKNEFVATAYSYEGNLSDKIAYLNEKLDKIEDKIAYLLPYEGALNLEIAEIYSQRKSEEPIAIALPENVVYLPKIQEKSRHLNQQIASIDNFIRKLPKEEAKIDFYHVDPITYQGDLNDLVTDVTYHIAFESNNKPVPKKISRNGMLRQDLIYNPWLETFSGNDNGGREVE